MRKAKISDLNKIEYIIEDAKRSLKEDGVDQWQVRSLNRDFLKGQIEEGKSYVLDREAEVIAYCYLSDKKEKEYEGLDKLFKGQNYYTIHTFAIDRDLKEKRLGTRFLIEIIRLAESRGLDSLRVDTHEDNRKMRGLLNKLGFKKVGEILVDDDGEPKPRLAYELVL